MSDVAIIAGPVFIILLVTSLSIGVLTGQVFLYYVAFPNDNLHLKLIVWSVYILEFIQTVMITYTLFQQFVYGFQDVTSIDRVGWNWLTVPILGGVVAFIVQNFYVHRIVVMGRFLRTKRVSMIAVVIVFISVVQLVTGIIVAVQLKQAVFYSHLVLTRIEVSAGVLYGAGTISDLTIAICMTIILLRSSTHTHARTRKIVRRLVRLTIEAGSLTAFMSVTTIVLVIAPAYGETYYQPAAAALSKLYSIAMMAVLLNRMELSNRDATSTTSTGNRSSTLRFSDRRGEASTLTWSVEDQDLQLQDIGSQTNA